MDAVELDRPSTARLHDALLGGDYHFGVDRRLATRLAATVPGLTRALYAERYFLDRAIRLCLGEGIRQFLDLGCGLPTVGNARAVIHRRAPTARVGCVDLDPVVIATLAGDLIDEDRAAIIRADIQRPDEVLDHPTTGALLDLDQPVGVLAVNVLHLIDQPGTVVGRLMQRLAGGSVLVASHLTAEHRPREIATLVELVAPIGIAWVPRSRTEVQALFTGLTLAEPGLVDPAGWRPDVDEPLPGPGEGFILAGIGRTTPDRHPCRRDRA